MIAGAVFDRGLQCEGKKWKPFTSSPAWRTRCAGKAGLHSPARRSPIGSRSRTSHITLAECAYGSRGYELTDLGGARLTHIPLRATTMAWAKENLLNIAIHHLPPAAEKIATLDADVTFRGRDGRAKRSPRSTSIRSSSHGLSLTISGQMTSISASTKASRPSGIPASRSSRRATKFWAFNGGPYAYPHPGFAWGWQRRALDRIGGLFELGGMGSGDHHMALGMVGEYRASLPAGVSVGYHNAVASWSARACAEINGKLGFAHGTIEHPFHGRKGDRGYQSRWSMFLDHGLRSGDRPQAQFLRRARVRRQQAGLGARFRPLSSVARRRREYADVRTYVIIATSIGLIPFRRRARSPSKVFSAWSAQDAATPLLWRCSRTLRTNPGAIGSPRALRGLLGPRPIWLRPDVAAAIMIHGMLEGLLTGPAHHQRDGLRWPDRRPLRGFPRGADLRRMEQVLNVRADIGNGNRASHPEVTAIGGLQQALKMLGYRITVDGDCGRETRKVVASF